MNLEDIQLIDHKEIHHYEFWLDKHKSFIDYKLKGDTIYLIHTEVPKELEGKGVAATLVKKVFNDIESRKLKLVPLCSYIQIFLKRHPEWNHLVLSENS